MVGQPRQDIQTGIAHGDVQVFIETMDDPVRNAGRSFRGFAQRLAAAFPRHSLSSRWISSRHQ
jgi:hypothetical protein